VCAVLISRLIKREYLCIQTFGVCVDSALAGAVGLQTHRQDEGEGEEQHLVPRKPVVGRWGKLDLISKDSIIHRLRLK
jgi:hypothetical protein